MLARRIFLGAVFAGLAMPVMAQSTGDISGVYNAEGRNPDGSRYTGKVTVQESVGGAVAFAWIVANQSYAGVGTRDGRVVSVDWGADHPVVYVIMPDGALHGTWGDGRALERLTK